MFFLTLVYTKGLMAAVFLAAFFFHRPMTLT